MMNAIAKTIATAIATEESRRRHLRRVLDKRGSIIPNRTGTDLRIFAEQAMIDELIAAGYELTIEDEWCDASEGPVFTATVRK